MGVQMKIEARIIGPESELGVFGSLDFYGHSLTREWSEIDADKETRNKLAGNRYVEIRGDAKAKDGSDEVDVIRARLDELGVKHDGRESLKTLQGKLDKAEAAKAKQDEEEAEVLAEAARIQAEQEA